VERKSINFELKDLDRNKRTAIIAHAVYDNVDFTKDISRKGMFTKSWSENKENIAFYLNHNDEQAPGKVVDVYEDNHQAYTKAWLGTHTLGNDVLTMMDEGVIKKASFGFITEKSNPINIKGQKVRELKEVVHLETSVLTKLPANIKAGVRQVTKSLNGIPEFKMLSQAEQNLLKKISVQDQETLQDLVNITGSLDKNSDLFTWVTYAISRRADMLGDIRSQLKWNTPEMKAMQDYVAKMEKFCRNTTASDDCIKSILLDIEETKSIISEYNTAFTRKEPGVSGGWNEWLSSINHLKTT
jgi:HK97 family phage prohead protease